MIVTVCHGCQDRHIGCHGTCEKYLEQKAEMDAIRERKFKENMVSGAVIERAIKKAEKARKNKK